jgi:carbamate kinase
VSGQRTTVRIVVALGDDAVARLTEPITLEDQRAAVAAACAALAPIAEVHELVIALGRGPQAELLSLPAAPYDASSAQPFEVERALAEGRISYLLEQELGNLLPAEAPLATVLTMIEVDPDDAAFTAPTAVVGPVYTAGPAHRITEQRGWAFHQDGKAWRRVVPAPQPRRILEIRPVEWLLARGCVVICAVDGGTPTMHRPGTHTLVSVEAVIDVDRASAVLAQDLGADLLVVVDTDAVHLDRGVPGQRVVVRAHPDALDPGLFPSGAVAQKVRAASSFARASGRPAVIGSLQQLAAMVAGGGGTRISVRTHGVETRSDEEDAR